MSHDNNVEIGIKLIQGIKLNKEELGYLRKYWQSNKDKPVINWDTLTEEQLRALDPKKLSRGQRSYLTCMLRYLPA
jgi:hypothetical protein